MPVPVGRLTRGQIVALATRKAGNTQLGANTPLAGADAQTWLNQVLYDLYTQYNWPFLNTSASLVITSASFPLPSDFLKAVDEYSLEFLTVNGLSQVGFVQEVDRGTFEAVKIAPGGNISGFGQPRVWTADRNASTGLLFPDPTGTTITAVLRYQQIPADIDVTTNGDATIPTFPYSNILVQALYVQCLVFEFDGRADGEQVKLDVMLEKVRQAAQPLRSVDPALPLDTAVFSTPFRSD